MLKRDSFFIIFYMGNDKREQFHKKRRHFSAVGLLTALCMLLSGCAGKISFADKGEGETEFAMETLGLEPDFSYERKPESPSVQVDRLGYLPGSSKIAVFQGEDLPERFRVMAENSGKCVYEGDIRIRGEAAGGIFTGYGNFTGLQEEGSYYIECDRIGCSYYFDVKKEVYLETAEEYGKIIEDMQNNEGPQETVDICEVASYLLTAYEMYPELLTDIWNAGSLGPETEETEAEEFFQMLRKKTDLLLTAQDEKTGGIYGSTEALSTAEETPQEREGEVSEEATAAFAGTMAKYGYLYQEYDWDYANICLKAASKAWRCLERTEQRNGVPKDSVATGKIYAASELYRASNERLYHNYILQNRELVTGGKEDLYLLMGKVTYLFSRRTVDHELCGEIMAGLMKSAEETVSNEKAGLFLIQEQETDAILWDMTVLALANYAIMNHEYATVIENHLHYLLGRNEDGALLMENPDGREAAKMLLLFSLVEAERRIVEEAETETE